MLIATTPPLAATTRVGATLKEHFSGLRDPRKDINKKHGLLDIIIISICAVISGARGWEDIESFGKAKYEWLMTLLALQNGLPAADTFRRVFARLKPQEFQRCFINWVNSVRQVTVAEIVPIDGKTLKHSYDRQLGKSAIHMVSAWAASNRLVLGQVKVSDKSNEITAIPDLLKMLELTGCIVTIDALGCQKQIVSEIVKKKLIMSLP
jgi:predicted transposase YbfD/YdcC